jgi:hypothetical protein
LGKAIIEQKMVRQLREVLNRHSSNHDGDMMDPEEEVMNVFKSTDQLQYGLQKLDKRQKMGPKTQFSTAYLGTGIRSSHIDHIEDYEDGSEQEDDQDTDDESNTSSRHAEANDSISRYARFPYFESTSMQKKQKYGFGSVKMGRRAFQDFLQMIQEEKNLLDLKRVRNDIVTQIRKKKAQIGKSVTYCNNIE